MPPKLQADAESEPRVAMLHLLFCVMLRLCGN
jgi:hypothetical protein